VPILIKIKYMKKRKQVPIFISLSYGTSERAPHTSVETIRVPFGSKTGTDFDAPDVGVELYGDDLQAPDLGKCVKSIFMFH
jgi:hypothetical protein